MCCASGVHIRCTTPHERTSSDWRMLLIRCGLGKPSMLRRRDVLLQPSRPVFEALLRTSKLCLRWFIVACHTSGSSCARTPTSSNDKHGLSEHGMLEPRCLLESNSSRCRIFSWLWLYTACKSPRTALTSGLPGFEGWTVSAIAADQVVCKEKSGVTYELVTVNTVFCTWESEPRFSGIFGWK